MHWQLTSKAFNRAKYPVFLLGLIILRIVFNHVRWHVVLLMVYTVIFLLIVAFTTHHMVKKQSNNK